MLASTFFDSMLRIQQPPIDGSGNSHKPVIDVSEGSHVIDTFLRVVYPLTTPRITSLFHLGEVLEAAMKYDASVAVNEMRAVFTQPAFLTDDPLQVFTIAYTWHFEEETKIAAAHAVVQGRLSGSNTRFPALDGVTAGAYYRLMQLSRNHAHSASNSKVQNLPVFDDIGPFCREAPLPPSGGTIPTVSAPFTDRRADLVLKSRDGRAFRVHRAIIECASPTLLSSLVLEDAPCDGPSSPSPPSPTYRMPESSAVVDTLLRFLYPVRRPRLTPSDPEPPSPNLNQMAHFLAVLAAMQRYALPAADDLVHAHWPMHAARGPFRFFFHAIAHRLAPEAHACARVVACGGGNAGLHTLYVPEMEGVGALAYHRLLAYVQACREAALQSVRGCSLGFELNPTAKPGSGTGMNPNSVIQTQPCVRGLKCVCADRAPVADPRTRRLLPVLLHPLEAKLDGQLRGRVLLDDRAVVDALAAAAHSSMCVRLGFLDCMRPPFGLRSLLVALMLGSWSLWIVVPLVAVFAIGQISGRCRCPEGKHIPWAEARLRDVARRVDEAVAQVGSFC